jgi:hypothetical protein
MTTPCSPTSRFAGLLAPLASVLFPGCGQMLQGRFAVGLRHASLALLLVAVGVPMSVVISGPALCILGCWSAYDAWRMRCPAGPTPATDPEPVGGGTAGVGGARGFAADATAVPHHPEVPPVAWWRRGMLSAFMVALQAVAAVEIMFLIVAGAFSVMAFDAPGGTGRLDLWAFVIGMNLLPWVGVFLCGLAWGLHGRGRTGAAAAILAAVVLAGLAFARLLLGPQRLW